jgi:hypothetical protein
MYIGGLLVKKHMTIEERVTPLGFLILAKEYYSSFLAVNEKYPQLVSQLHTKYFLICHCIELIMKAELRMKGITAKELKSSLFGHDFDKLLVRLYELDIMLDKQSTIQLGIINEYYKTKQFEYPLIGSKSLTPLEKLSSLAHLWMGKVEYHIHNDKKK